MKYLSKYQEQIYALLRIVVGLLFIPHGIQKMHGLFTGAMPSDNLLMILAAVIETVGGFLIIIGWNTRLAAYISSGEMAVAYFKVHFASGLLPINNHGELAVLYCFVLLFIAANGSGSWSVDKLKK